MRTNTFLSGELGLFGFSFRLHENVVEGTSEFHLSWDTAGVGSLNPPKEFNEDEWEKRYGDGKENESGQIYIWIILIVLVVIVMIMLGVTLLILLRHRKTEKVPEDAPKDDDITRMMESDMMTKKCWDDYKMMYGRPHPDSPEGRNWGAPPPIDIPPADISSLNPFLTQDKTPMNPPQMLEENPSPNQNSLSIIRDVEPPDARAVTPPTTEVDQGSAARTSSPMTEQESKEKIAKLEELLINGKLSEETYLKIMKRFEERP
jgi:uncharacterized protein YneF (UPF0154 family)